MMSRILGVGAVVVLAAFSGCQKKEAASATPAAVTPAAATPPAAAPTAAKGAAPELVKESERSRHFAAVNKQLELGGTVYGYVDIDGDVLKLTSSLKSILGEVAKTQPEVAMVAQQDLNAIATKLGLTDVKAFGVSSVPEGNGAFRNRMFLYTGGERHGLMAGLGGKPAPLKHIGLAPADVSFYGETEMDMAAVYKTLKEVVSQVAGEPAGNQVEASLKMAGEIATLSFLDLIYGLKGRSAIVLRVDSSKPFRVPGPQPVVLPAISLLICVDGVGQVVESSLMKSPVLRRSEAGTAHIYEFAQRLPIEGLQPAIVIDGTQLFVTTSPAFLKECREQKTGLAQTPAFQRALANVGAENNGITYLSPKFYDEVRALEKLNPDLPPESKAAFSFVFNSLPKTDIPLVAARINLDDGILIRSHMNRSSKQDIAMFAVYNPVTIGLFAAMAVPAFQKVRGSSQEKAVTNNLRQLSAAADQYYLETGTRTATYDQLVGPGKYVRTMQPVAGENYRSLRFEFGTPLRVRLADGRTVEFKP